MHFDIIVGNPPYQKITGNDENVVPGALPIYQLFVDRSKGLMPRYLSMIIPGGWLSGDGIGLKDFFNSMIGDRRLSSLWYFERRFFSNVDIRGGVCYFLWEREKEEDTFDYTYVLQAPISKKCRVGEYEQFFRCPLCEGVVCKVKDQAEELSEAFMEGVVSPHVPFGLHTNTRPNFPRSDDLVMLRHLGGTGAYARSLVKRNCEWIDKWKVIVTRLVNASDVIPKKFLLTVEALPPGHVCTGTYLVVATFDEEIEAQNCCKYLQTCFVQFLIYSVTSTQNLSKSKFAYVPMQDFREEWTDAKLYSKYNLTPEEIALIESRVRW